MAKVCEMRVPCLTEKLYGIHGILSDVKRWKKNLILYHDDASCHNKVLQCSDGLSNKVSNIIRRLMDKMKLLLIYIVLLSQYFFYQCMYGFIPV